jgi:hypothetical protein
MRWAPLWDACRQDYLGAIKRWNVHKGPMQQSVVGLKPRAHADLISRIHVLQGLAVTAEHNALPVDGANVRLFTRRVARS